VFIISSVDGPNYIVSLSPTNETTNRTVLLSHQKELIFDSLTQVIDNPMFSDWSDEFNIDFKDLKLIKKVGEGSSGKIYEGVWKGVKCAAKKIDKSLIQSETFERFRAEIQMLKRFRFPNIILYMGMCVNGSNELYIITEFMERGNLRELLRTNLFIDWPLRISMAIDIANGMNYLHSHKPIVIHRVSVPQRASISVLILCILLGLEIFQHFS
jgi:hypothetical protein